MSVLDRPTVTIAPPPVRARGTVATVAVVAGVVCAAVGLLTPAVEFYAPAAFGVVVIVLAIIGFEARGRAWTALALGGLILAEAVYGVAQLGRVEHELGSLVDGARTGAIVDLAFGTTYDGTPVSVGLSRPVAYLPSESASRTGRAVTFNIAVTNRDARPFPVRSLDIQAFSGMTQDEDIEDGANNVGTSSATLLPGRSLVWQIAFAIPKDAEDITVQIGSTDKATLVFSGIL